MRTIDILVVDDDGNLRSALSRQIKAMGTKLGTPVNVDTASDGQEGIEKFEARYYAWNQYDAVFTDLKMPRANGIDLVKRVKSLLPSTPVYIVTAWEIGQDYEALESDLENLSIDGVLQKPFLMEDVEKMLKDAIEKMRTIPPSGIQCY